jgi:hypothetical protein
MNTIGPGLLAAALGAPLVLLAACLSRKLRRRALALLWFAPLPALAAALMVMGGAPLAFDQPALRVSLFLDTPGAMLLAVVALLWIATSAYAFADVRGKPNAELFAVCWLLTLIGSLGVFIAADLLTFYLVYALVSIPAFGLIAHDSGAEARRAGGVYMAFTVLGEAFLLMGFALLAAAEPSGSLRIADVMAALPGSPWRDAALALTIAGFGLKIALVPMHGWMPLAYTAAPIPAATVLSGAAVKAGVIGLIRFLPFESALPGWGDALAVLGLFSAFYGVAIGNHATKSEDGAGLLKHQPDGRDRRRAGQGPCRRGQGNGVGGLLCGASCPGERRLVSGHRRRRREFAAPPVAGAPAGGGSGAEPRRTPLDGRRAGEASGKDTAGRWRRRQSRNGLGRRNHASHAAFPAAPCARLLAKCTGCCSSPARPALAGDGAGFYFGPLAVVPRRAWPAMSSMHFRPRPFKRRFGRF